MAKATTTPIEWLEHIYPDASGWLTLFSLHRDGSRHTDWAEAHDLDTLAQAAERRAPECDVWFGVATRKAKLDGGRRGGSGDCDAIPGLWLDVDIAGPGHRQGGRLARDEHHARQLLDAFPLPPTAVVHSGGGLQAWWLFGEMVEVSELGDILASWGATWNRLADKVGIDVDNVFDVSRVMRLPGTTNRKEGLARPVEVIEATWGRRYGIDDLDSHLDEPPAPPKARTGSNLPYIGPERPGDAYNLRHTGGDVLARAGFTLARTDRNGDEHWVRPGKDAREGTSATVYRDDGHTTMWSDTVATMWPAIEVRRPYDPFGLYACIEHGGDYSQATKALRQDGYGATEQLDDLIVAGTPTAPVTPDDEWPDPIPLGAEATLPPFPVQVFPDWITDFAAEVAEDLQVPIDLPASLALGALSTLAAGRVKVNVHGRWTEHANLYLVIAMPPSTGKSPAYKAMCGPVAALEAEYQRMMRPEIDANLALVEHFQDEVKRIKQMADFNRDALADANRKLYEAEELPTALPKFTVGDATPEALAKLISDNGGRMAVHSTEGGVFDLMTGRYSDRANLDVYLQAWSGDRLDTARIGREANQAAEALLTMVLTVQPSVIAALAERPELAGRGLTARFMYAIPPDVLGRRDLSLRAGADDVLAKRYEGEMMALGRRLLSWQVPVVLRLDQEAAEHYTDWRQGLEARRLPDGDLRPLAEWTGKLESSVLRLAALLHIAWGRPTDEQIGRPTMAAALAVGEYWMAHATHVHDLWGTSPDIADARHVLAWAERKGAASFTVRDLYAGNRARWKRADDVLPALEMLTERGWIRTEDGGPVTTQRNKRSVMLVLHPRFSTVSARYARAVPSHKTSTLSLSFSRDGETCTHAQNAQDAQNVATPLDHPSRLIAAETTTERSGRPPEPPDPLADLDDDERDFLGLT